MLSACILTAGLLMSSLTTVFTLTLAGSSDPNDKHSLVERDGVKINVFEHAATGAKMEFVTNSGICETTPGVNQYSGYFSVGTNMSMWFWFFEARNSPSTAPLATWFNGGPGCSSMIGLFQENGPCQFYNGASTPSNNSYSFNNYANMLYIDQPIGVGFSYGTDTVTSTVTAAPFVWKLLQAFFTRFPQYESRDFGIFTESYGGHYGPEFADYFSSQNAAIDAGRVMGERVDLVALGVNNGWFDPILQYRAYIDYSYSNNYRQLVSASQANSYLRTYTNRCVPALRACPAETGTDQACANAASICYNRIEGPLSQAADFNVYDVRQPRNSPYPPSTYVSYLQSPSVMQAIGAMSTYQECPSEPYYKFSGTGDNSRSFLQDVSSIVNSGVTTVIWAGDSDWICNWLGNQAVANAVSYPGQSAFRAQSLAPYTVNGKQGGTFKTQGKLSFLRVFEAGHEVMYYQPELSLQVFVQTMQQRPLAST